MGLLSSIGNVVGKVAGFVTDPISSLIGTGLEFLGNSQANASTAANVASTNAANYAISREGMEFNAAEAQKNRDFQAAQSSTAYQRAVADMRAAGISPMLAYQQGGASTPGGATASASPIAAQSMQFRPVTSGAGAAALSVANAKAQIALTQASTAKALAEAKVIAANAPYSTWKGRLLGSIEQGAKRVKVPDRSPAYGSSGSYGSFNK